MTRVNLIPRARLERQRTRRHAVRWITACGVYALFVVVALVASRVVSASDDRALHQQIERASREVDDARKELADLQHQLEHTASVLQANRTVGGQPDWGVLLALLAEASGDDIVLQQCRLESTADGAQARRSGGGMLMPGSGPPSHIELAGLGWTQGDVARFALRMEQVPLFEHVKLQDTRRERLFDDHAVSFRLHCMLDTEGESAP